jgi:putative oxidoreductase
MINTGLLLLRLVVGILVAVHGTQKLSHRLGADGLEAAIREFTDDGFRGGWFTAVLAGGLQAASGLALSAGFLVPLDAAALIGVMLVAASTKRGHSFWAQGGGAEYPLVLVALVAISSILGPGPRSFDHLLGLTRQGEAAAVLAGAAIGLGVVGAGLTLPLLKVRPRRNAAHAIPSLPSRLQPKGSLK